MTALGSFPLISAGNISTLCLASPIPSPCFEVSMRFRRSWFIGGFAVLVMSLANLVSGCGGGSITAPASTTSPGAPNTPPATGAAPAITSVTPATVPTGSAAFTLQVNGSGFVSGSVVYWNKSQLTTTFVSSQQLQAAVPGQSSVCHPSGTPNYRCVSLLGCITLHSVPVFPSV